MQTERVTFLTTRDHKAALDAYAARTGQSVGNLVRDATMSYIKAPPLAAARDEEEAVAALLQAVNEAVPRIQASLLRSCEKLAALHAENEAFFRAKAIAR
jgi:hypothetical protein